MKIGLFNFKNYGRTYSYEVVEDLALTAGHWYKVQLEDGGGYNTALSFIKYSDHAPAGIQLRKIVGVEEVENGNN